MSSNYLLADLISTLNVASRNHLKSLKIHYCDGNMRMLAVLYKHGVIRGFSVDNNRIRVFLKYNFNKPIFHSLKVVSTPGKRVFWSLSRLLLEVNFVSFSGFFIVSTTKGYLSSYECLFMYGIAGEILVKVEI